MYKVIGSDNREYGPASEETVRRWIVEGRANAQSQAQSEGETAWRALGSFPEFATALAAGASAPPPPPAPAGPAGAAGAPAPAGMLGVSRIDAGALAERLCARPSEFGIGRSMSRGFQLFQDHFWILVGAWAVSLLIQVALSCVPYVGGIIGVFLGAVFLGGMHWFILRLSRGEPATVGDVFAGFGPALGPLILVGVVSALLECVGLLLCILPGLYLMVAWHYASILVIDKKVDFWAAMELSRKVVTRHWFAVFGLMLLAVLLWIGGFLLCCIGIFIAGPIASAAIVYGYRDLFEEAPEPAA
jgi:hypothetical protein